MSEDRLNALSGISEERNFVESIADFDNKVINFFSGLKNGFYVQKIVVKISLVPTRFQNSRAATTLIRPVRRSYRIVIHCAVRLIQTSVSLNAIRVV